MNDFHELCQLPGAPAEYRDTVLQYQTTQALMESAPKRELDLFILIFGGTEQSRD